MKHSLAVPKGMRVTPQERGIDTRGIVANDMREILASHQLPKSEELTQSVVEDKGHLMYMLPKFHCELNPTEQVWAQESAIQRHTASITS